MVARNRLSLLEFRFFAFAACLLPVGIFTFHVDWPPLDRKHLHFAEGDIGKTILACAALFFAFALGYFFFPRIFHRRMNQTLGQIHFWLNVIAFLFLLALPIYFNLFFPPLRETPLGRGIQAFGYAMSCLIWGIEVLATVQLLFFANVLWSAFKGGRTSSLTAPD
jgi:heme/copper-type cytochrome/quinol oxidase subunit 1